MYNSLETTPKLRAIEQSFWLRLAAGPMMIDILLQKK
jgi:hypothetical protein